MAVMLVAMLAVMLVVMLAVRPTVMHSNHVGERECRKGKGTKGKNRGANGMNITRGPSTVSVITQL